MMRGAIVAIIAEDRPLSCVIASCLRWCHWEGGFVKKQSNAERMIWTPSVFSCLHLEQLKAEHVIAEPQQADSHEMAFHSVCTALCQCCACEPPSSTNWSKHSALLIAFGWYFWILVCVCCVLPSLPWQRQTNIEAASHSKPTVSDFLSQSQLGPLQHPMMLFTTLELISLLLWLLSLASCPTYIPKFILPSLNTKHPTRPLFGLSVICHYVEQGNSFWWEDKRMWGKEVWSNPCQDWLSGPWMTFVSLIHQLNLFIQCFLSFESFYLKCYSCRYSSLYSTLMYVTPASPSAGWGWVTHYR